MHDKRYSTTRRLTTERPDCFDAPIDGVSTLLKTSGSDQKIAEGGLRLRESYKSSSDDKPLITVVTVVFNGVAHLEDTIQSVIGQTYDNVEYIVVDGGSKDGTLDIIQKYGHAIDYWVSEPDKGIYDAMNKGIDLGSGDWINFMNAGDKFFDSKTIAYLEDIFNENYGLIYGDMLKNGFFVKSYPEEFLKYGIIHACHQSIFFNLSLIKSLYFRYNLTYKIYGDYDLVARIYKLGYFLKKIDRPISIFQDGGVSSNISRQKRRDKYISLYKNFGVYWVFRAVIYRFFKV